MEKVSGILQKVFNNSLTKVNLEKKQFAGGITILRGRFRGLDIDSDEAQIMYRFLMDLKPAQFEKGIMKFCQIHKEIYPNTNVGAYIREYALIDELSYSTAAEAWGQVNQALSKEGFYGSPTNIISDKYILKAINILGWNNMCKSPTVGVTRAHFIKVYEQLIAREKQTTLLG